MADEPTRTRTGEHDGVDAWITADAVDQLVELIGDFDAEQAVGAAVDSHDQGGAAVLDLEVAVVLVCHQGLFPFETSSGVLTRYNEVIAYITKLLPEWQVSLAWATRLNRKA